MADAVRAGLGLGRRGVIARLAGIRQVLHKGPVLAGDNGLQIFEPPEHGLPLGLTQDDMGVGLKFLAQEPPDLLGTQAALALTNELADFAFLPGFAAQARQAEDGYGVGRQAEPPAQHRPYDPQGVGRGQEIDTCQETVDQQVAAQMGVELLELFDAFPGLTFEIVGMRVVVFHGLSLPRQGSLYQAGGSGVNA